MYKQKTLWKPSAEFIQNSNLKHFEHWLSQTKGLRFDNYQEIWQWSTDHVEDFWGHLWEYFDVIAHAPHQQVLSGEMPTAKWFDGATLNYAEHIFRHRNEDHPALVFRSERHLTVRVGWEELERKVHIVQKYLKSIGIGKGDRVAVYLPNIPEAVYCFLAVNSLGAIWSCCSPDFGVNTVIDRFAQIEPKLFIAVDGYQYNGKAHQRLEAVKEITSQISSIENTLLVPYLDPFIHLDSDNCITWEEMLGEFTESGPLTFTPVPFEHPIWVLYSSGTTGKPKAITHSHGGVLLEHLKYLAFHNDTHPGEYFFWFTTTGWMMWNFLQASMLVGAIPVLYDGSPAFPDLHILWALTEELPIHHFGTSAPYLTALMKNDLQPKTHDLSALRSIGSTGAPLPPEVFEWIYENISENVWLCSMSGGTDVCTAFVGGCPYEPVYKGAIQCRALGCAMKAYDENGKAVVGQLGEMVIEKPMPSMPVFFWNDPGNKRYLASYFDNYPNVWQHGDWIKIFNNGSLVIQGRSDATLNRKGVRIGTAEIYAVLDKIDALKDSMVLNIEKKDGGDIMPLFIVLDEGEELTEELQQQINQRLKQECSPRHVPDFIKTVPDIPYTLSGKKMEVPVKKILMGMDVSKSMNKDAVRNPDAIVFFERYAKQFAKNQELG